MGSLLGDVGRAVRSVRNQAPAPLVNAGPAGLADLFVNTDRYLSVMGTNGLVFAIVNGIAEATAGVPWHLYRSAASGNPEDRTLVTAHQALKVWNRPNKFMPRATFVHRIIQHRELVGESEWMVGRAGGTSIPTELWPIRPDRMTPDPHPTEFMTGWNYRTPNGIEVPLGLDEVIQLVVPNPEDPYRGLGPVQSIIADIDSARSSSEWTRNFFRNNARPGGVVEIPNGLSGPQFTQLVDRWNYAHKGVRNANRVAFLEGGAKYVGGQFTQRDMQFVELHGVTSETIRTAWRFPTPLLGTVTDVNRANAEAAELMMARWLIVPRLLQLRDVLNTMFLPLFGRAGEGVEFDFDSPVADDRELSVKELEARTTAYSTLIRAGVNRDDAARVVGLPPMRSAAPTVPATADPPTARGGRIVVGRGRESCLHAEADRANDPTYQAYEAALAALLVTWSGTLAPDLIAEIVDRVRQLHADDPASVGDLSVDGDVVDAIERAVTTYLTELYATGGALAANEAGDAGFAVDPAEPTADVTDALVVTATVSTAAVVGAVVGAALSEAVRVMPADTETVTNAVRAHLNSLTDAYPAEKFGGAGWAAVQAGRVDTAEASGLKVVYVADERLDRNTCKPCRDIDGAVYYSADAMRSDGYSFGGYLSCLGRDRCRGFARVAWNGEV